MFLSGVHVKPPALPSAHVSSRVSKYALNDENSSALSTPDAGSYVQRRPTVMEGEWEGWEGREERGRETGRGN